jgi:IS605 OrfB family transposase
MIRTVKLSLKHATSSKRRALVAVLDRYQVLVNKYTQRLWEKGGGLDTETYYSCESAYLSRRYHSRALNQALSICKSTKASARATGNAASCPQYAGTAQLSDAVVKIEPAKPGSAFDYMLKVSTLSKGNPVYLPVKGTRVLNKWLSKPGAVLKGSCGITADYVLFYVEIPDTVLKTQGRALSVDVGLHKMLVDSDGNRYGERFRELSRKVGRKTPGSAAKRRARRERDNYINQVVNELPWSYISTIVVENLKNLKRGKKPNRGKNFRKALAPWTYAYVLERIKMKAAEHRVLLISTSPAYTSQTCPECGHVARSNRAKEEFKCCRCGHADDADHVGALNILARGIGELGVSRPVTS